MLSGRTIVVGVTGGIAAYKAAEIVSMLKKRDADVRVIMTKNACEFVAPLTFETLSGNPVVTDMFKRTAQHEVEHIALAKRADAVIIAPATANIIAKAANGTADDFLSTFLLAVKAPVIVAPAMNFAMLENEATRANIKVLESRGFKMVYGKEGRLACGDVGSGRMAEPREIIRALPVFSDGDLSGIKILVTAGPTREKIDYVRYLTNKSSGKMGYAIAEAAADRGADVTLISGPTNLEAPFGVKLINVVSAKNMYDAVMDNFKEADVIIKAAAVADYTPETVVDGKIKKTGDMTLRLVRTPDIAKHVGQIKENRILVGFAAEADKIELYAKTKMEHKNLDMIVANDVSRSDIGFNSDENEVTLYFPDGTARHIGKRSKYEVAEEILFEVKRILDMKKN